MSDVFSNFDESKFNECYRQYSRLIFSIAFHIVLSDEEAEDVVQETFLRYSQQMGTIDNQKYWLIRVATNLCNDKHRRSKFFQKYVERTSRITKTLFMTISGKVSNADEIKKIFEHLDERDRSMLILKFGHDYNYNEIAEIMGIPEGTVKSGLSRLLKKIEAMETTKVGEGA